VRAGRAFERVAGLAVRRPWTVIAVVLALAAAGTVAALGLRTDAGTGTLVDENSSEFRATEHFRREFGDDAAVVLVREDLRRLLLTKDLEPLFEFETCLAGGTPVGATLPRRQDKPLPAVCDQIAKLAPSRVVYGPATFLYESVAQISAVLQGQIGGALQSARSAAQSAGRRAAAQGLSAAEQKRAANDAARAVLGSFQSDLIGIALRYGLTRQPTFGDPQYVSRVVFDPKAAPGTPKERFKYLFPSPRAALISVRLRPDLTDSERHRAISLFRQAAADPRFALSGGDYVISGIPAVVDGLAGALRSELFVLLGAAVLTMALVLALILAPPLRLLGLGIALLASALTFGLLSVLGGSLTMASIAVLPVLIGLAVDYAIQFQARFNEGRSEGLAPARAAVVAAARGGPVIATACLATAAGFAALALSPIPMVRSFGLLLVAGVAIALGVAATAGFAALALAGWRQAGRAPGARARPGSPGAGGWRAAVWARLRAAGKRSLAVAIARPGRVLAAAVVLAACGWVAGTGTSVVSDIRDLAPSSLPALRDVNTLQRETGVSGEVDVVVRSDDLTNPKLIAWMRSFQRRVLERHGYAGPSPSCDQAEICPALSLTDLFSGATGRQARQRADALLRAVPPYFSQAVVTRDPKTGRIGDTANIAFGIRVQPLDEQQRLIDDIRAQIDPPDAPGPPKGTVVELAGLPVIAAAANQDLARSRLWLPLVGLAAVALVLLAVYRSPRRALVPLIPIVLATGWSALLVAAMSIPLNPMSATLGALVIAIATEFSVILSARYEQERGAGLSVGEALRRTYARTGTAVLASGTTVIAGFAALAATDIRMLRDFGLVTVADLAVALAGVLVVLPAALVWAEEGFPLGSGRSRPGRAGGSPAPAPYGVDAGGASGH
jgi:hydrophobe/amphiphile efflux-3 (HAE3) family protein